MRLQHSFQFSIRMSKTMFFYNKKWFPCLQPREREQLIATWSQLLSRLRHFFALFKPAMKSSPHFHPTNCSVRCSSEDVVHKWRHSIFPLHKLDIIYLIESFKTMQLEKKLKGELYHRFTVQHLLFDNDDALSNERCWMEDFFITDFFVFRGSF